jgi:hypothetical protein
VYPGQERDSSPVAQYSTLLKTLSNSQSCVSGTREKFQLCWTVQYTAKNTSRFSELCIQVRRGITVYCTVHYTARNTPWFSELYLQNRRRISVLLYSSVHCYNDSLVFSAMYQAGQLIEHRSGVGCA